MGATTGLAIIGNYAGVAGAAAKVAVLKGLIPNPDSTSTSGAQAGGGLLDEMSPVAAAQLRVELDALADNLDGGGADVAYGQYTVVTADDTEGHHDIVTGLADTSLTNIAVTITRSGSLSGADAVITEPTAGTIRIADGSTYKLTAGDIITWFARQPSA